MTDVRSLMALADSGRHPDEPTAGGRPCPLRSMTAPLSTGPSLSDQAYRALRQMIVDGKLSPGERITERALG